MKIGQGTTAYPLVFLMVQSADHVTGLTGAAPTVTLSKNGGAFGAAAGAVTEIAYGWYKVAGNATDNNTLGPLALHATAASGGDPTDVLFEVVAEDLTTAVIATVTNLTNAPTAGDLTAASGGDPTDVLFEVVAEDLTTAVIATVTNLTNAPTAGDLTATMKASVVTATHSHAYGANYGGKTFEQLFGKVVSMLCGPTAGLGTPTEIFKTPVSGVTDVTTTNDGVNRTGTTLA